MLQRIPWYKGWEEHSVQVLDFTNVPVLFSLSSQGSLCFFTHSINKQ